MSIRPRALLEKADHPFLAFPVPRHLVAQATQFRSTWLSASLRSLRERNLLASYLEHLPRQHHEAMLQAVVGVWLPIEVAMAHYEACDALALSEKDIVTIGTEASDRAQGTMLGTATKLAAGAGVTPWTLFAQLQRLWERIWIGGAVGVFSVTPAGPDGLPPSGSGKEAQVEIVGWPCARIPYCRVAMRGVCLGMTELFCRRAFAHEISEGCTASTLAYRLEWA